MAKLNTLLIGKHIYKILAESQTVNQYVGTRVFPIVTEAGTKFPFIVFTRTNINSDYSKDGITQDLVTVEINVVSNNYSDSCTIANEVRNLIDNAKYKSTDDIYIKQIHLTNVQESYQDDSYVQTLTFQMVIQ